VQQFEGKSVGKRTAFLDRDFLGLSVGNVVIIFLGILLPMIVLPAVLNAFTGGA
jgi:hypothetical protein